MQAHNWGNTIFIVQREHGFQCPEDLDSDRASWQETVKNRDSQIGQQLH